MTEIDVYLGLLDCIHESAFLATKYNDTEEEDNYGEDEAIEEAPPIHFADTGEHIAEVGEYALERIALEERCQGTITRNCHRINHWCSVHPKLHTESDEIIEVSILDRKSRDDKTTAKAHEGNQEKQDWKQDKLPCQVDRLSVYNIIYIYYEQRQCLYSCLYETRCHT